MDPVASSAYLAVPTGSGWGGKGASEMMSPGLRRVEAALRQVHEWARIRNYAGYDPFDTLNSPALKVWLGHWPLIGASLVQFGKRIGGVWLRRLLCVPPSKNPKALSLFLAGCCDLARTGENTQAEAEGLKRDLVRLRSPEEQEFCWGYDWDYFSFRGTRFRAYSPNAVATVFCASSLLDYDETFDDLEARQMAVSAAQFIVRRLNRSVDTSRSLCFSYTPLDRIQVYNSSALAAALLARVHHIEPSDRYLDLARRSMQFLRDQQQPGGAWAYGALRRQSWIDSFHTGYNLEALLNYQQTTGDTDFEAVLLRGYRFYKEKFFLGDGTPKYFASRRFPIDIHCCSQAILTFCAFRKLDPDALAQAARIAYWTIDRMRNSDGSFYYQRHRLWNDRTPYMRWGQAWMFRALARLVRELCATGGGACQESPFGVG